MPVPILPGADFRQHHVRTLSALSRYIATGERMSTEDRQFAGDLIEGLMLRVAARDSDILHAMEGAARAARFQHDRDPAQWGADRVAAQA
jgi:hypothetical protein